PARTARRIKAAPFPVARVQLTAERLPFPDAGFDCAVSTWTLCSIPDAVAALREVRRVLKPGGVFVFLEHGRSDDAPVARWHVRPPPLARGAPSAPADGRAQGAAPGAQPRGGRAQHRGRRPDRAAGDRRALGARGSEAMGAPPVGPAPRRARGAARRRPHGLHDLRLARPHPPRPLALALPSGAPRRPRPRRVDGAALSFRRGRDLDPLARGPGARDRRVPARLLGLADDAPGLDPVPSLERAPAAPPRAPVRAPAPVLARRRPASARPRRGA